MEHTEQTMLSFYQILGRVFYGIAAADKVVRTEEVEKLKELVRNEWEPLESGKDAFGSDAAAQIEIVFDWLYANDWQSSDVLTDLQLYIAVHGSLFTREMNSRIMQTASAIADSFAGTNKSELVFLSQLKLTLEH